MNRAGTGIVSERRLGTIFGTNSGEPWSVRVCVFIGRGKTKVGHSVREVESIGSEEFDHPSAMCSVRASWCCGGDLECGVVVEVEGYLGKV